MGNLKKDVQTISLKVPSFIALGFHIWVFLRGRLVAVLIQRSLVRSTSMSTWLCWSAAATDTSSRTKVSRRHRRWSIFRIYNRTKIQPKSHNCNIGRYSCTVSMSLLDLYKTEGTNLTVKPLQTAKICVENTLYYLIAMRIAINAQRICLPLPSKYLASTR
jgi:hypothetical protein